MMSSIVAGIASVALLGFGAAGADLATTTTPYDIGGDVKAPVPVHRAEPQYSPEARQAGAQGNPLVEIVIDEKGDVASAVVVRPVGFGLDETALAAVKQWKFRPATRDGQAVPVRATVEINFRLMEGANAQRWQIKSFSIEPATDVSRPVARQAQLPTDVNAVSERGTRQVTLRFRVDESGAVQDLTTADPEWMSAGALREIGQWKFDPARKAGEPVSVWITLTLYRGQS